ncbi:MAG: GyrI-like domain-containing protein [Fibrobacterales bacterium]
MLNNVTVINRKDAMTIELPYIARESQVSGLLEGHFSEVKMVINNSGIKPIYLPFVRRFKQKWSEYVTKKSIWGGVKYLFKKQCFNFGYTVVSQCAIDEPLIHTFIPEGSYFKAIHTGKYSSIHTTYKSMIEWIVSQGFDIADESIEFFTEQNLGKDTQSIIIIIPMIE